MREHHELFGWKVTRVLFSLGGLAVIDGVLMLVVAGSWQYAVLVVTGVVLVAISTRGPWDSEASGRNRSVLGFRARPGKDLSR